MRRIELDMPAGPGRVVDCDHSGLHSPVARYDRRAAELRYLTVCDDCGAETAEVLRESYAPAFDPRGNERFLGR